MSDEQTQQAPLNVAAPPAPPVVTPAPTSSTDKSAEQNDSTAMDGITGVNGASASNAASTSGNALTKESDATEASTGGASAQKKEKRKSISTVSEPKSKKLNRKKSITLQLDAQPGDHYWARLKGYPPWPSIVCDDEMLPEILLQNRPVTAKRPDGSYREDYQDEGKNARDRTYPVMYLGTYEFSWAPNTEITPLSRDEVQTEENKGKKMSKMLQAAYAEAEQWNTLEHYKAKLADFAREREEAEALRLEEQEQKAKAAAEKKAKREQKAKRKSKGADDADVALGDGEVATPKEKKTSKKRRKEADGEEDQPAKTPKTIKLSSTSKTPNGDSATKSKSKPKSASALKPAAKVEPQLSEAEKKEKRQKEILYFRHRLQKGFLTRDVPPKEEDMGQMGQYFDNLEKYNDLDGPVIRDTRIHKVLKGIIKLASIPRDAEFKFKERSLKLLNDWNKILGEGEGGATDGKMDNEGGKSGAEDERPESKAESTAAPEGDKPSEALGSKEDSTDETKNQTKDEPADVPMPDAKPTDAEPSKGALGSEKQINTATTEAVGMEKTADGVDTAA